MELTDQKYDEIVDKVLDLTLGGYELDDHAKGFVSRLSDFLDKDGFEDQDGCPDIDNDLDRVLERLPGAEVGREREGSDHLSGADRPLAGMEGRCNCSGIRRTMRA